MNSTTTSPRRARSAAAAGLLLALAIPLTACLPKDKPQATTTTTPTTIPAETTTTTEADPGTTVANTPTTLPTPTTTATTKPPKPGTTKLRITDDGIGPVTYGMHADQAIAELTEVLGAPDSPGFVGGGFGACGVTSSRWTRWGNLQVQFTSHGGPLVLTGFWWGDTQQLPSSPDHPKPVGPGTPAVHNDWDVRIGKTVRSDELLDKVKDTYADATFLSGIYAGDSAISMTTAPNVRLVIDLHPDGNGDFLVEHLRTFDPRDMTC